jgi:hypothetical protein
MSYNTIHVSSLDDALNGRITACCMQEHHDPLTEAMWAVYTAQDVEQAYAYALSVDNPNPGGDETVVTDGMILAVIQAYFNPAPLTPLLN